MPHGSFGPEHDLWEPFQRYERALQIIGRGIVRTDHFLDILRFTQQPSIGRLGDALVAADAAAALLDEAIASAADFAEQGRSYELDDATQDQLEHARGVWTSERVRIENVRESLRDFADLPVDLSV